MNTDGGIGQTQHDNGTKFLTRFRTELGDREGGTLQAGVRPRKESDVRH